MSVDDTAEDLRQQRAVLRPLAADDYSGHFGPGHGIVLLGLSLLHLAVLIVPPDWSFSLSGRFAQAGLLGFWLIVGPGRMVVRFLFTVIALVLTAGALAMLGGHWSLSTPLLIFWLVCLTASAMTTLAAGLWLALIQGASRWEVRFNLWELMLGTGACALALVVARTMLERTGHTLVGNESLPLYLSQAGAQGAVIALGCAPLLVRNTHWRTAAFVLAVAIATAAGLGQRWVLFTYFRGQPTLADLLGADFDGNLVVWLTVVPALILGTRGIVARGPVEYVLPEKVALGAPSPKLSPWEGEMGP